MSVIEEEKTHLGQKERIAQLKSDLFQSIVDVVKEKGQKERDHHLFNWREVDYTVTSSEPHVDISLLSKGRNPDKAKNVYMWVQGVGCLKLKKIEPETFKASEKRVGSDYYSDLDGHYGCSSDVSRLEEYSSALRQVKREIETK